MRSETEREKPFEPDQRPRPLPRPAGRQMRRARHLERRPDRLGERRVAASIVEAAQQERRLDLGSRQHLEGHLGQEAERAMRPALQLREIEAGDVLHHPAAGLDRLARAVDETHADQVVADRARREAPRPGAVGSHEPADGRLAARAVERAMVHRLDRQPLAAAVEFRFEHRDRRSGASRDHEFRRFVERDRP